jgi:hypothetical protein
MRPVSSGLPDPASHRHDGRSALRRSPRVAAVVRVRLPPEITLKATKSDWLIPAGLIALSLVPAVAGVIRLAQLAGGAAVTPDNGRFFAAPIPVVIHIPVVITYCILGAFQFSPGFRRRHRGWHRARLCGASRVRLGDGVSMAQGLASFREP